MSSFRKWRTSGFVFYQIWINLEMDERVFEHVNIINSFLPFVIEINQYIKKNFLIAKISNVHSFYE